MQHSQINIKALKAGYLQKMMQSAFQLNALMGFHWSDVDQSCPLPLHQLVIFWAHSHCSILPPPPPPLSLLLPHPPSTPLHLLLNAWRCPANLVYAGSITPLSPSRVKEEAVEQDGWLSACATRGGCKRRRQDWSEPAKAPLHFPVVPIIDWGDERRPESEWLTTVWLRSNWFGSTVGCPAPSIQWVNRPSDSLHCNRVKNSLSSHYYSTFKRKSIMIRPPPPLLHARCM